MDFGVNQSFVEEKYLRYRENPKAVGAEWRRFFEALSAAELAQLTSGNGHQPARTNGGTLVGMPAPAAAPAATPAPAPKPSNGTANGNGTNGNGHGYARADLVEEFAGTSSRTSIPPAFDTQQTWNEYQERVTALVQGYRMRGHRFAQLDPLGIAVPDESELSLSSASVWPRSIPTRSSRPVTSPEPRSSRCARSCGV